jgi:group II intron reverse transcriptase/maturase
MTCESISGEKGEGRQFPWQSKPEKEASGMLDAKLSRRLEAIAKVSQDGKKVQDLFKIMRSHESLWLQAYANIYANQGAVTPGVNQNTLDGFSDERVTNIIQLLEEDRYHFQPSQRVYIPKANGKLRPLGLPTGDDKLVQEVARILLERIYEPIFSDWSHGFRPNRSCHTALQEVRNTWDGVKWILEIDIEGFFDNIDHSIMVKLLEAKIDDWRFIKIIRHMLRAGYLEDWKYHRTYSGTPQGGIISPILANIYLHALDLKIAEVIKAFNIGKKRAINPEYKNLQGKTRWIRKKITQEIDPETIVNLKSRAKALSEQLRTIPSVNPFDSQYKRIRYVKYADDFLLGIIGSRQDAEQVMIEVTEFLSKDLNLRVSKDKSDIRHSKQGVIFLGYEVRSYTNDKIVKIKVNGTHTKKRTICEKIDLYIPETKLEKFCKSKGYGIYQNARAARRAELLRLSDLDIVSTYNAEFRGLANYYALACDAKQKLSKLQYIWQGSLLRTLADKHKSSVKKQYRRLHHYGDLVYHYRVGNEQRERRVFNLKQLKTPPKIRDRVDLMPNTFGYSSGTELLKRYNAHQCEYCGTKEGYFEVHHVRKLSDMKDGKEPWQKIMIARQRKTLVLCVTCHDQLHAGKLPSWKQSNRETESAIR